MAFFSKKKDLLPKAAQEAVVAAIRVAEAGTSGELRVFVERHCPWVDAMDRARELFEKLDMHLTDQRNGILIYLATDDHQFAIIGDEAIFTHAGGPVFWEAAALQMRDFLRNGLLAEALVAAIQELGRALATHFPPMPGINKNELPDDIVFGK